MTERERHPDCLVPCIICGEPIEHVDRAPQPHVNQPYRGTAFSSHGHYGSTAFDPIGEGLVIEVNFCDPCLVEAAEKQRVLVTQTARGVHFNGANVGWQRVRDHPYTHWGHKTQPPTGRYELSDDQALGLEPIPDDIELAIPLHNLKSEALAKDNQVPQVAIDNAVAVVVQPADDQDNRALRLTGCEQVDEGEALLTFFYIHPDQDGRATPSYPIRLGVPFVEREWSAAEAWLADNTDIEAGEWEEVDPRIPNRDQPAWGFMVKEAT